MKQEFTCSGEFGIVTHENPLPLYKEKISEVLDIKGEVKLVAETYGGVVNV
ncbi:MAG: hypothetical protein DRJ39_03965, partial [Thermoprotei archaeon]